MRIAYLVSQYPAPSHTFIRRELEALRARGLSVDTFSVRKPAPRERTSQADQRSYEETFYLLPPPPLRLLVAHATAALRHPVRYLQTLGRSLGHRVPGGKALLWSLFYFAEAILLADELRRRGVDHLNNHFANSGANVGFLASYFLDLPWSLTLHGISEFDYPAGLLLAEKIRHAKFVACVSHFGRAQAFRLVEPAQWPKLFINRCGVDLQALPTQPQAKRLPQERIRILCVGRLSPEKGHAGLLQAFSRAVEEGYDAELRLAGDGPEHEAIAAQVAQLGLQDRCTFLGLLPEAKVLEALTDTDIFVSASFMEGLPVVLMEALALRVPVIAPRVAGIPELVRDGETGLLFSPAHWEELTACLTRLCADPELRVALADEGNRVVAAEFDISVAVKPLAARLGSA